MSDLVAACVAHLAPMWETFAKTSVIRAVLAEVRGLTPGWAVRDKMVELTARSGSILGSQYKLEHDAILETNAAHEKAFAAELVVVSGLSVLLLAVSLAVSGRRSGATAFWTLAAAAATLGASVALHYAAIWYDYAPYVHTIVASATCVAFSAFSASRWASLPAGVVDEAGRRMYNALRDDVNVTAGIVKSHANAQTEQREALEHVLAIVSQLSQDVMTLKEQVTHKAARE